MEIVEVTEENVSQAGRIHSESWKESHRAFCSPEFVEKHTPQAQTDFLRREMESGKRCYMLLDGEPVGIVSLAGDTIENLYVLPWEQGRGYGSALLRFAVRRCSSDAVLWVLNTNCGARRLYRRFGFIETGKQKQLNDKMYEIEMIFPKARGNCE